MLPVGRAYRAVKNQLAVEWSGCPGVVAETDYCSVAAGLSAPGTLGWSIYLSSRPIGKAKRPPFVGLVGGEERELSSVIVPSPANLIFYN